MESALFTVYENSPSKWVLKLSLKRKLCFSRGPVEGSDVGIRINGGIGIRPNQALPALLWNNTRVESNSIVTGRGGRQQQRKRNKVNRSDNKPSLLKQTTRWGTSGFSLNWHQTCIFIHEEGCINISLTQFGACLHLVSVLISQRLCSCWSNILSC